MQPITNGDGNVSISSTGSSLDIIMEKTANIEEATNANQVKSNLLEIIRTHAKRERTLRESTIMIDIKENLQAKDITDIIEDKWVEGKKQVPATYWQDKDKVFVQFVSKEVKNSFLDFVTLYMDQVLRAAIARPTMDGFHFQRKPTRFEISNVRSNIKADRIKEILNRITANKRIEVQDFREGKPNPITKARSVMFKGDAEVFKILIGQMDGSLPYTNQTTGTKIRLSIKINCKPWMCRDCYSFGQHQCQGRICMQCGNAGHQTRECKQKTKFCKNCKRRGHKAKDVHCPVYQNEVAKELRKQDIPVEYMEENRAMLIKFLQIK